MCIRDRSCSWWAAATRPRPAGTPTPTSAWPSSRVHSRGPVRTPGPLRLFPGLAGGCRGGWPGVFGQGGVDGVQDGQAVVAGRGQVGVDAAPSGQGLVGLPVTRHRLVSFGGLDPALARVVRPDGVERAGE